MTTCSNCQKQYETYTIIQGSNIEFLAFDMHIRDIYYDDKRDKGLCENCRNKLMKDPVFLIRSWMVPKMQLEIASREANMNGDKIAEDKFKAAIIRIDLIEKRLEQTPEVKELYMKNNPAMFKEMPKLETKCHMCGENKGQTWINDPNTIDGEYKIEDCWWVCIPCQKIIEKIQDASFFDNIAVKLEDLGIHDGAVKANADAEKLYQEAQDIAFEDGQQLGKIAISLKNNMDADDNDYDFGDCDFEEDDLDGN